MALNKFGNKRNARGFGNTSRPFSLFGKARQNQPNAFAGNRRGLAEDLVGTMRRVGETVNQMSVQERAFREQQKLEKEYFEAAKSEEKLAMRQGVRQEKEEMVKREKMMKKLIEILMKNGKMNRIKAIEVAKGMVNSIRDLKLKQAISQENYNKLIANEDLLLKIAQAA